MYFIFFAWIIVTHLIGVLGIYHDPAWFLGCTPYVIAVNGVILVASFERFKWQRLLLFFGIAVVMFFIFVLAAQTKSVVGNIQFGNSMGYMWRDVPVVVGINWAMLIVVAQQVVTHFLKVKGRLLSAFVLATAMTCFDLLMEVVTPLLGFWHFPNKVFPPLENFIAWWSISFVLGLLSYSYFRNPNRSAWIYGISQVGFFVALGFLLIQ